MSKSPARQLVTRSILPLAAALLSGACASNPVDRSPREPDAGVYVIASDRLVQLDAAPAAPARRETGKPDPPTTFNDVRAMTYDPASRRFYAISGASSSPRLITIDPVTGDGAEIGPLAGSGLGLTLVDGLAIDPRDGTLYAAGGIPTIPGRSTFTSNILLTVDPTTGAARQVARIRGTIQEEVDALVFVDGTLYAVDGAAKSAALYRIEHETGRATRLGQPFSGSPTDLAYDPTSRRLFAAQEGVEALLRISLDGEPLGEVPVAEGVTALAIIPSTSGGSLFSDGFESGDGSAWSGPLKQPQD